MPHKISNSGAFACKKTKVGGGLPGRLSYFNVCDRQTYNAACEYLKNESKSDWEWQLSGWIYAP